MYNLFTFFFFLSFHRILKTSAEDVTDDVLQLEEQGVKNKEPNLKKSPSPPFSATTTMKQKRN